MQAPEPDWFPSRVDLRKARRWERARFALMANLLFVACLGAFGWFGFEKDDSLALGGFALCVLIAFSAKVHSFIRISRRKQFEAVAQLLNLTGAHVECRFFEGEFEVGTDTGYLAREGGMLRFEGETSRFAISPASLASEPNLDARNPDLMLSGARIRIKPDGTSDADLTSVLLNRWLRHGGTVSEERLPPRLPQARSWTWYFERGGETYILALGLANPLAYLAKNLLVPERLQWLRLLILGAPLTWFLIATLLAAIRIRREDQRHLADRESRSDSFFNPLVTEAAPDEVALKVTAS